jgi:hypothetical protein
MSVKRHSMLMSQEITDRARALLEALQRGNKWMSRAELANATGKAGRLSPHDFLLLDRLAQKGLIEVRKQESKAPVGERFEYRAIGE